MRFKEKGEQSFSFSLIVNAVCPFCLVLSVRRADSQWVHIAKRNRGERETQVVQEQYSIRTASWNAIYQSEMNLSFDFFPKFFEEQILAYFFNRPMLCGRGQQLRNMSYSDTSEIKTQLTTYFIFRRHLGIWDLNNWSETKAIRPWQEPIIQKPSLQIVWR